MRALVLHGPGDFRVEDDWPEPDVKPGWALVRVAYAGICGSDLPRFTTTGSYHHPMILGHEFTGVVARPAPDSDAYNAGDRVAVLPIIPCGECPGCETGGPFHCARYQFLGSRNDGGFAQYCLVPESNLFPLPEGVCQMAGALLEPLAVGLHVLRRAGFQAGQSGLVFGAGPIGLLVGFWLQVFGARRVVMADVRSESLDLARQLGFAEAVDPREDAFAVLPAFDVVFEAAGARAALLDAIDKARDLGVVAVVGRDTVDTVIPLGHFERLMRKELTVRGCWGYNVEGEREFLTQVLDQPPWRVERLVTHTVSLDEAPDMIRCMAAGREYYCKVLVNPWR
jgi:L-iditol 2-dehydrogenase